MLIKTFIRMFHYFLIRKRKFPKYYSNYFLQSFSQTGSKTMVLKDARLEALIDTAKTFTHSDIEEITLAYECAGLYCYRVTIREHVLYVGEICNAN